MNKIALTLLTLFAVSCTDSENELSKFPQVEELSATIGEINQTTKLTKVTFRVRMASPYSEKEIFLTWGDSGYDPFRYNYKLRTIRLASGEFEVTIDDVYAYGPIGIAFYYEAETGVYYTPTYEYTPPGKTAKMVTAIKYSN